MACPLCYELGVTRDNKPLGLKNTYITGTVTAVKVCLAFCYRGKIKKRNARMLTNSISMRCKVLCDPVTPSIKEAKPGPLRGTFR